MSEWAATRTCNVKTWGLGSGEARGRRVLKKEHSRSLYRNSYLNAELYL